MSDNTTTLPASSVDAIRDALNFDPLREAERIRGTSYMDDAATLGLGVGLALAHNRAKEAVLREFSDSYFSMSFNDQLALFADLGFEVVYRETFAGSDGDETFVILWHGNGLLATCESYDGTHRNSARVYYNYRHPAGYPGHLSRSGCMHGDVWTGDHDAREGIRHSLDAMRAEGEFVSTWTARPFLWLLNYSESKSGGYDDEAINEAKIAQLPEHVRRAITPSETV